MVKSFQTAIVEKALGYTVKQLIRLNRDLRVTLTKKMRLHTLDIREEKAWPLLYLIIQAINLHEAIGLLISKGFGPEAGILLRSMLEVTINVMWICKDPEIRLARYADYRFFAIEQYRDLGERLIKEANWSTAIRERWDKKSKQREKENTLVKKEAESVKDQYGFKKRNHWSGMSLKNMANEVGWLHKYEAIYKIYSEVIHSSIGNSKDFITSNDSGAVLMSMKSLFPLGDSILSEAFVDLTVVFSVVNDYVGLGLKTEIDEANRIADNIISSYQRS